MNNERVAIILYEIADLLALEGVPFKPQAYRRVAETIASLSEPIEQVVVQERLADLPGVGEAIEKKIREIVETGSLRYHDELKAKLPIDLYALTRIDGVGPKTAKRLYEELGICNLADLDRAARHGRIRDVKGLGAKSEEKILRGLGEARRVEHRILLGEAVPLADDLVEHLTASGRFGRIEIAGSLRRARETIGDLDVLATADDSAAASAAFVRLPEAQETLAHGSKKSTIRLSNGVQVDLRIVPPDSYGAALQYFTGSKDHNVALRKRAIARGWKLNEYGLFDVDEKTIAGEEERNLYQHLGLQFIPPELREDRGEIEAAEQGMLPVLLEAGQARGDLHVHTHASDGRASLQEMVDAARARGLAYIAVTDHAKFAEVIGGLTPETLRRQIEEIAELNRSLDDFAVLCGIEANVGPDGILDVADALLARLDVVIASVHSHFRQSRSQMTERLCRVCLNPHVDILGHPTTRKIGERAPIDADWDAVFEAAARGGTAMEVNANPIRIDLNAELARRAIDADVKLAIGTDAHTPDHFDFLALGILTARRGWATSADVLNTRSAASLSHEAESQVTAED